MTLKNDSVSAQKPDRNTLGIWDTSLQDHLEKTDQMKLPQAPLLSGVLNSLTKNDLIEEAYLRGSFSFGKADYLSDIDLFAVVEPEKLYETHTTFQQTLNERGQIIIGCHDKFVKDYGGVGFMYLSEDQQTGKLHQFDLYLAVKGAAPRNLLFDAPRIYSKNPTYCWLEEESDPTAQMGNTLPSAANEFIAEHTKPAEKNAGVISCYNDLLVGLFIMDKHLKRQQPARAFNDNNQNMNALMDIFRYGLNKYDFQIPTYAFDSLSEKISKTDDKTGQEFALAIRETINQPISKKHIEEMFVVGTQMVQAFAPDYYTDHQERIAVLDKRIFKTAFVS